MTETTDGVVFDFDDGGSLFLEGVSGYSSDWLL